MGEVVDATIQAVLTEDGEAQVASEVGFKLVPIRPTNLTLTTTPERLSKDDKSLTVNIEVTGPDGTGLAGRDIGLSLAGAKQVGPAKDKDGTYAIEAHHRSGSGRDHRSSKGTRRRQPVRDITAIPTRSRLPVDGLRRRPSRCSPSTNRLPCGRHRPAHPQVWRCTVAQNARTDATGMAQVTYTNRTPGLVHQLQSQNVTLALGCFAARVPPSSPSTPASWRRPKPVPRPTSSGRPSSLVLVPRDR